MTETTEKNERGGDEWFCKACGSPAGGAELCPRCEALLALPEQPGLVVDEGAVARRAFEGRDA
jgi:hypothetical protein